jgi:DNA primase
MALAEGEIAQVRAATDIVALIGEQVALKKTGRRWTGLCPFHGEQTASFSVNAEEGVYYCFGCRASGDAITFVRETQHLDFMDAVRLLADRANITLHEDANAGPAMKDRQEFLSAMGRAVEYYHEQLLESPSARPAREYLKSRGINGEVARQFNLGWAPDDWDALMKAVPMSDKVLTGTGLGFTNSRGRKQDFLRARIVFPIYDVSGRPIAIGGRILPDAAATSARGDGRIEPKYKNSSETAIYSKRRTLYALNWAKDNIVKTDEIIVCEGYTDVIAFFMAGMPRAVATCGTALGEDHFRTMKNFAKRIVLAYDADQAGQSAAASVYQWEKQYEIDVAVAKLPKGTDPAELALRDPEALRQAIAQAVPFLEFRLSRVLDAANLATPEGRARAAELAIAVISEHPSDLVRDQYIMNVADTLKLDSAVLRPRVAAALKGAPRSEAPAGEMPRVPVAQREALSRPGVAALKLTIDYRDLALARLVPEYFVDPVQREAFAALFANESVSQAANDLLTRGDAEAAELLQQLASQEPLELTSESQYIADVTAQLVRSASRSALLDLERELRSGTSSVEHVMTTIRDVRDRLEKLDGDEAIFAENELREWLQSREKVSES